MENVDNIEKQMSNLAERWRLLKKNQKEIKNIITKKEDSLTDWNTAEEIISELENMLIEISITEIQRELKEKNNNNNRLQLFSTLEAH